MAAGGIILEETARIFRKRNGEALHLYQHQEDAIRIAAKHQSYVVTSGTGSGKTLTYFIPIFDTVLRGNCDDNRVWAIVIYPMNALVNSQHEALEDLRKRYEQRYGRSMPVRFAKYTGQETEEQKNKIRLEPPHILLTNFMMLEMMMLRPRESQFVDRDRANLQFLVLDELHMYRGRQGADVAMLIRRLKERCGNPQVFHVGTSATMVADPSASGTERRRPVADFASQLFGTIVPESNIIEETLVPIAAVEPPPSPDELGSALREPTPATADELLTNPLTRWMETAVGIEEDKEGIYRRKIPRSLSEIADTLSNTTGESPAVSTAKLQEMFLAGSREKRPDGGVLFAFKLHQFISQGRSVYATLEAHGRREFTLDGQYYARSGPGDMERLLFPLTFCRVCGQEYYKVLFDEINDQLLPWDKGTEDPEQQGVRGYVMIPAEESFDWSNDHLPPEWLTGAGRVKQNYRTRVPREIHPQPDGFMADSSTDKTVRACFQMAPFLICQYCGEYYTLRDRDFRKLAGLSSEGRSSATTTLSISALDHAEKAGITGASRKLLSFTDNRQDASLQAGHFNDFVLVSLLRAPIYRALEAHGELRHYDIADKAVSALEGELKDIAANPNLDSQSAQAGRVRKEFRDLIQYRIYEDLRRAWRIVHPNLEQCGLLRIGYEGLEGACNREDLWQDLPPLAALEPEQRLEILKPILDIARKKLAIRAQCLEETYQQQLRQRVNQVNIVRLRVE